MTPEERSKRIKAHALELGFDSVGITGLAPPPHSDILTEWLEAGMAGTMTYMHRQAAKRCEPRHIVADASRAVMVSSGYYTENPPRPDNTGCVARYARGRDYHDALRKRLATLADFIRSVGDETTVAQAFVDAGPVPERELAQRAGLGWIGKNTMLIDPRRGSFFFLASVFTNADVPIDPPFETDRCGTCRRCLDACPTEAFPEARVLDSRRCLSYLTIEHRGPFDEEAAQLVGEDWIFGCDICQDVCPWNAKFAKPTTDAALAMSDDLAFLDLSALANLDDAQFESDYGWTPMERTGAEGLRRNAKLVQANQGR